MILILLLCIAPVSVSSQTITNANLLRADSLLSFIHTDQALDSRTKSNLADSAFRISLRENDVCRQVQARSRQATYLDNMGMADSALVLLYWASHSYKPGCDSAVLMNLLGNLTNIFVSLNEFDRIDSVSRIALKFWNHKWKDKDSRFAILNNLGIAQAMRNDSSAATATFWQAYTEARENNNSKYIQKALINLGSLKGMTGDLDSAYYFLNVAAANSKEYNDMDSYMTLMINLANVDIERGKFKQAIVTLDSVYNIAVKLKSTESIGGVQNARATAYANMNQYDKAYKYLNEYIEINNQYLDEERVRSVTEMMEKYESEKKARQIQQLELEKLDAALTQARITNSRNRFLFIGIAILVLAAGLWWRLRYVHRSRAAIQHEKDISEGLLLNILPASVASELKSKGFAEAKHFAPVTILFSDFKGFTTVSEDLTAAELVEELNVCFKTFDNIMMKYGIEKIKTIGDAYMAAGSIPDTNTAKPDDVIKAGLDMQQFVISRKKDRDKRNLPAFDMRVGIHSGPVVAGIVGVNKFQYDLWGDTVNIASRMESNSEVGRVNISETTYQLVRENPSFSFTPRGMIDVKGKGKMAMYFVDAIPDSQRA